MKFKNSLLFMLLSVLGFSASFGFSAFSADFIAFDETFSGTNPAARDSLWRGRLEVVLPANWTAYDEEFTPAYFDFRLERYPSIDQTPNEPVNVFRANKKYVQFSVVHQKIAYFPGAEAYVQIRFAPEFPIRKIIFFPKTENWGSFALQGRAIAPARFFALFDDQVSIFQQQEKGLGINIPDEQLHYLDREIPFLDSLGNRRFFKQQFAIPLPPFSRPYLWFGSITFQKTTHLKATDLEFYLAEKRACETTLLPRAP